MCKTKFNNGGWCVGGEFNSVRDQRERKGSDTGYRNFEVRVFRGLLKIMIW